MPDWIAIVLRPLALLVLLTVAVVLSRLLKRVIPDGPVKRALYTHFDVIPPPESVSPRTRFICTTILLLLIGWITFVQLTK